VVFLCFLTFYAVSFALYFATEDFGFVTIPQLPFAALVYFGCYALINIGYHLFVLEDCKDAQDEIKRDIKEA
jgi:hypothetical protein